MIKRFRLESHPAIQRLSEDPELKGGGANRRIISDVLYRTDLVTQFSRKRELHARACEAGARRKQRRLANQERLRTARAARLAPPTPVQPPPADGSLPPTPVAIVPLTPGAAPGTPHEAPQLPITEFLRMKHGWEHARANLCKHTLYSFPVSERMYFFTLGEKLGGLQDSQAIDITRIGSAIVVQGDELAAFNAVVRTGQHVFMRVLDKNPYGRKGNDSEFSSLLTTDVAVAFHSVSFVDRVNGSVSVSSLALSDAAGEPEIMLLEREHFEELIHTRRETHWAG